MITPASWHITGFNIIFSGPGEYHRSGERDQYKNLKKWVSSVVMEPGYDAPEFYDVILRF